MVILIVLLSVQFFYVHFVNLKLPFAHLPDWMSRLEPVCSHYEERRDRFGPMSDKTINCLVTYSNIVQRLNTCLIAQRNNTGLWRISDNQNRNLQCQNANRVHTDLKGGSDQCLWMNRRRQNATEWDFILLQEGWFLLLLVGELT